MHFDFWNDYCPEPLIQALWDFCTSILRHCYNNYRNHYRIIIKKRKFKKIVVKYGLLGLVNAGDDLLDNNNYLQTSHELSVKQKRRYCQKMVELSIAQDASLGIAQNFLRKFASLLVDKHAMVQLHIRDTMTPLIVRDINTMLYNWRFNNDRIIREAFTNKSNNISVRKAANTRKAVKTYQTYQTYHTYQTYQTYQTYNNNHNMYSTHGKHIKHMKHIKHIKHIIHIIHIKHMNHTKHI